MQFETELNWELSKHTYHQFMFCLTIPYSCKKVKLTSDAKFEVSKIKASATIQIAVSFILSVLPSTQLVAVPWTVKCSIPVYTIETYHKQITNRDRNNHLCMSLHKVKEHTLMSSRAG